MTLNVGKEVAALSRMTVGESRARYAGQMSLYLTYAKEHLAEPGENEPVGIILCSDKDDAVVHYSMGHMPAKVFASRYYDGPARPGNPAARDHGDQTRSGTKAAARGLIHGRRDRSTGRACVRASLHRVPGLGPPARHDRHRQQRHDAQPDLCGPEARLYWDDAANVATSTAAGNKQIGKVVKAAADADATVRVRMNQ